MTPAMNRLPRTTAFWLGRLPHWEVEDGRYFVTIHLAGAIPVVGRAQLRTLAVELSKIPRNNAPAWLELQRKIFREMEAWLDTAKLNTDLNRPKVASMVMEAVEHRQKRGTWQMFEYAVMPTH